MTPTKTTPLVPELTTATPLSPPERQTRSASPNRVPGRAFSLVEVVVAITVGASAAYMFGAGFAGIYAGLDDARDLGWARRLASLQLNIFEQYGPRVGYPNSGQLPGPWNTKFPGEATGNEYKMALNYTTPGSAAYARTSGSPNIHQAGNLLAKTSDWHVMSTNVPWISPPGPNTDYQTVLDMGYDVEVYLAPLQVTYQQTGADTPFLAGPPPPLTPSTYYVAEVDVLRNNSYLHSVQMIF